MPNGAIRIKIPPFDSALEIVLITDVKCITKLEVTNARKLLPRGQNFGLGCSKSGYNPWIIQFNSIQFKNIYLNTI
jgi:hypothetical protein